MCEHVWVLLSEVEAMAPNVCKGHTGPTEMFPSFPVVKHPKRGEAVCFSCYEVFGQPGVINQTLAMFEKIMRSFE